jgi:hypothetical protein
MRTLIAACLIALLCGGILAIGADAAKRRAIAARAGDCRTARRAGAARVLSRLLPRESADTPYPQVLADTAEKQGVTLISVTPRIPRKGLAYVERRYDLEATGTLPALVAWLGAFERNARLVALPRIELRRDGAEWRANALVVVPYEREGTISVH